MYALIFIVYVQFANNLAVTVDRFEFEPGDLGKPIKTLKDCRAAGDRLKGPVIADTDPLVKFVWRDYTCEKVM